MKIMENDKIHTNDSLNIEKKLYHGSQENFDYFSLDFQNKNGNAQGFGVYLTSNYDMAKMYTNISQEYGYLYEVSVNLENEFSLDSITITEDELSLIIDKLHESDDILNMINDVEYMGYQEVKDELIDVLNVNESDVDLINELANLTGNPNGVAKTLYDVGNYTHSIASDQLRQMDEVITFLDVEKIKIISISDLENEKKKIFLSNEISTTNEDLENDKYITKNSETIESRNIQMKQYVSFLENEMILKFKDGDYYNNQSLIEEDLNALDLARWGQEQLGSLDTKENILDWLYPDETKLRLSRDPMASYSDILELSYDKNSVIRQNTIYHEQVSNKILERLSLDDDFIVSRAARNELHYQSFIEHYEITEDIDNFNILEPSKQFEKETGFFVNNNNDYVVFREHGKYSNIYSNFNEAAKSLIDPNNDLKDFNQDEFKNSKNYLGSLMEM